MNRPHRLVITSVIGLGAACLAIGDHLLPSSIGTAHAGTRRPPNIIMLRTDDQTSAQLIKAAMPKTMKLLAGHGTTFDHFFVTTPLCCPSRASVLTGQYGHNNGVLGNHPGYPALKDKRNVLPVWMQRAGYRTAHIGKWLNGFGTTSKVPAGWNEWFTLLQLPRYYGYKVSDNGRIIRFGHSPRDYVTRVLNREAVRLIKRSRGNRPLYLQLDERAPHFSFGFARGRCDRFSSPQPDPRDLHRFTQLPLPRPPSFNEADVSDKPSFVSRLQKLNPEDIRMLRLRYQCALASLRGVDRSLGRIEKALRRTHELNHTVIMFTSDNGFFYGEHRLPGGKAPPYEEALRVPLLIRVPRAYRRGPRVPKVSQPVASIDLTATILRLAGAQPCRAAGDCRTLDGRSLVGLLRGRTAGWPDDRAVLAEFSDPTGVSGVCSYDGVHDQGDIYTQYTLLAPPGTGPCSAADERERYDLYSDPSELENLCSGGQPGSCPGDPEQTQLEDRLSRLSDCSGIKGRDPLGSKHHYCD